MSLPFNMTDALSVIPMCARVYQVSKGLQILNFHHKGR